MDGRKNIRRHVCKAIGEGCVLGMERRQLNQLKRILTENGQLDEFTKLETVLRGNYLIKQNWK